MKMIDGLKSDSQKALAMVELSFNIVPPREDDIAELLHRYRDDIESGEATMSDAEYRDILGIN